MNKFIYLIVLIFTLISCSFDNKTGIWKGSDQIAKKKKKDNDNNIELIFKTQSNNIKEKELSPNQIIKIDKPKLYYEWRQSNQNNFNNINNVSFRNDGQYKKLSKASNTSINKDILFYQNNLFFSDAKGNIGVFSLSKNQTIFKFNFYKKKMKKIKKDINLIVKGDIIIAADNLGYIYSINYKKNKIVWAKNLLIPFRSNLKIMNEVIFVSDEKNQLIVIDFKNGNKIDELYTQPSKTVSDFKGNLALDKNNNLLFLSTNGTLYSLNLINNKIMNWIQNFKPESDVIFKGKPIIVSKDKIIITTNNNITLLNDKGVRLWSTSIKSNISPKISGNTIFTVDQDNFLVFIDVNNGNIIYSKNINLLLAKEFKKKFQRKINKINHIYITGNKLLLISNNSFFIEIDLQNTQNITSIKKNPFNILSNIIFVKNEMLFVSNSNRVYKVN